MNDWTVRKDKMEERYRKIICPNGHYSDPIKENEPLPSVAVKCLDITQNTDCEGIWRIRN